MEKVDGRQRYNNEEKAQARALLVAGNSYLRIQRLTGIPDSTVQDWHKGEWGDLSTDQLAALTKRSLELTALSDRIQIRELSHLDSLEPGSISLKDMMTLNAISGTHRDKLMAQPVTHQHIHFEGDPTITALAAQRLAELEAALKTQQSDD